MTAASSAALAANLRLKRAYEVASDDDGTRVLVERLWPRGVSKAEAALDEWMKEIAPTTELRKWFDHEVPRWEEFCHRYAAELEQHGELLAQLRAMAEKGTVTLIYAAHDVHHNGALVLRNVLLGRPPDQGPE